MGFRILGIGTPEDRAAKRLGYVLSRESDDALWSPQGWTHNIEEAMQYASTREARADRDKIEPAMGGVRLSIKGIG